MSDIEQKYREAAIRSMAALSAAISLLERGGKKAAPSDKMFEMMLNDYRNALEFSRHALSANSANSANQD